MECRSFHSMQLSKGIARTTILDGWRLSERLRSDITFKTSRIYNDLKMRAGLAVIRVGNQMEMERYVYAKRQLAFALGIDFKEYAFSDSATTAEIQQCITELNHSKEVNGIIVQLPLPKSVNTQSILKTISPEKDVDGCHPLTQGQLLASNYGNVDISIFAPSFYSYRIPTFGQHALVIGCSSLVGIPCFFLLQQLGMTCTMAHEHTPNTPELCRSADLVVSAVGNPGMIKGDWLKPGATIIDIGTRCVKDQSGVYVLAGDVDMESCVGVAGAITPVPGGVALLTTAMLMNNTLKAFVLQNDLTMYYNSFSNVALNVDN